MKARSKILSKAIILVLLAALTLMFSISVAASNTTLTTTVPSSFILTLEIEGKGTVTVNSVEYTRSERLEIPRSAVVTLQVLPDRDYNLESAVYNGEDITSQLKAGMVTLPALERDSQFQVIFAAKTAGPVTGDTGFNTVLIAGMAMVLSCLCFAMLLANRKKEQSD